MKPISMWELPISRGALLPVLVMLLGALPVGFSTTSEPMDYLSWQSYEIFDSADKEASLEIIKSLPVSHYEYKSDREQRRRYVISDIPHIVYCHTTAPLCDVLNPSY